MLSSRSGAGKTMTSLDYRVIASGSSGNAVRVENIMFDCGIPYKRMKEDLYKVDTLLITHSHSDHVQPATLEHIRSDFPRIKVYGNYDVAYHWQLDKVIGTKPFTRPKRIIIPFDAVHDVPCTGYIVQVKDLNILYCTDTARIQIPDGYPIDYCFLESNYDERKLRELAKQYRSHGYDPTVSSHRHLSTQKCKEFYFINRRNSESQLIELHKSRRFY